MKTLFCHTKMNPLKIKTWLGSLAFLAFLLLGKPTLQAAAPTPTPTCIIPVWSGNAVSSIAGTSATLVSPFVGDGSGDFYLSGNTNLGSWSGCGTNGCINFVFTNSYAYTANYKLEASVQDDGTNSHDTFFVQIIGPSGALSDTCGNNGMLSWTFPSSGTYASDYVTYDGSDNASAARVWSLGTGTYTIEIAGEHHDTWINGITILRDPSAATATPTPAATAIPATGNGLCMFAWNNQSLSGTAAYEAPNQQVAYNWNGASPGATIGTIHWSAEWTGNILIPVAGQYSFSTYSDDGSALWIDGTQVVNEWFDQSPTTSTASTATYYTAGQHTIVAQYYQDTGGSLMYLNWEQPSSTWAVVPLADLYSSGSCVAPTALPTSGAMPTATPTITPTLTPKPSVYQGLSQTAWLSGLEYIPFPTENNVSGNYFYDLSMSFTTAALNAQPKNTARYRIVLQNISSTAGLEALSQVGIETRIGYNGITCTSGYNDPAIYAASGAINFTPPTDPCNISTSYFWVDNETVPYTEQFDAMGDPREVPYRDMMGLPTTNNFANNYNWFWININDTTNLTTPEKANNVFYAPFLPDAQFETYNGGPYADVPKLFRLWRKAITHSGSIYTSMAGYDSYYVGLGGEIGGDSANNMNNGVLCNSGPWGGSKSSTSHYNEIVAGDDPPGVVLVADTGNANAHAWASRPWLGELWPDSAYWSNWYNLSTATTAVNSWGNLDNSANGGSWERTSRQNCDSGSGNNTWTLFAAQAINAGNGCATFQNGNGGSNTFDHYFDGLNATIAYDATVMETDYNFAVDSPFNVQRPWGINAGGNTPQEWSMAPYTTERSTLGIYSCTTQPANTWGFYNKDDSSNETVDKSSATVRNYVASDQSVGWYIVNGLAPATQSGIDFLAQFALLTCVRTFHDAGTPTLNASGGAWFGSNPRNTISGNVYRITPIPYIKIISPSVGTPEQGNPQITITWVERSARWDDHRYTENYPCLDNFFGFDSSSNAPCTAASGLASVEDVPGNEWHDSQPLTYNLKYSVNSGSSWYSVINPGLTVTAGVMATGTDELTYPAGQWTHSYVWNVQNLPTGQKIFRVEAYRTNFGLHYGFHTLTLNTQYP